MRAAGWSGRFLRIGCSWPYPYAIDAAQRRRGGIVGRPPAEADWAPGARFLCATASG